jgi:hypothetical protein
MVITKLAQKYRIGCGRGMSAIQERNLHFIINSIIDWDNSLLEDGDDKSIQDHYLSEGDCFCLGTNSEKARMVLAIDKDDTIVCIVNDTGPLALRRVYEEKIKPEYELQKWHYDKVDVRSWEPKNTATDFPDRDTLADIKINKNKYKIWRERFEINRGNCRFPDAFLELSVISDDTLGMEIPLYLTKYGICTKKDCMFLDIPGFMEDLTELVITWMYNEIPVIKLPKQKEIKSEDEENSCP